MDVSYFLIFDLNSWGVGRKNWVLLIKNGLGEGGGGIGG